MAKLPRTSSALPGLHRVTGENLSWPSLLTLVLWSGCLLIGLLGFALPYARPRAALKPSPPLQAEVLSVELSSKPLLPVPVTRVEATQPPPLPEPVVPPSMPALIEVAQPSPAIAFPLPVEGPVRIVEPRQAAPSAQPTPSTPAPVAPPPVQQLIHGQGEGLQPAPDYPPQALRAGQEGTVRIRFSVGENGRVIAAETVDPCPWGLLNNAAVRVVRERWRFRAGVIRLYEVVIRFEIGK